MIYRYVPYYLCPIPQLQLTNILVSDTTWIFPTFPRKPSLGCTYDALPVCGFAIIRPMFFIETKFPLTKKHLFIHRPSPLPRWTFIFVSRVLIAYRVVVLSISKYLNLSPGINSDKTTPPPPPFVGFLAKHVHSAHRPRPSSFAQGPSSWWSTCYLHR